MKQIKLTKNKYALVNDSDFEWLNQWKWCISSSGYAVREVKEKWVYMHRLINNTPDGFDTDHMNRNKLDNKRENLRTVTRSQNFMNKGLQKNNTSGHVGVIWNKKLSKWEARIKIDKKKIYLGTYLDIQFAILARKWGERIYFGKFVNWMM